MVRIIGNWLSERLGQPFVVENKPGAGTNLAVQAVANAPPDGYTMLFVGVRQRDQRDALRATLPFNFLRDIAPVPAWRELPFVLEVNPSLPAKTVAEFIAYAKANPGKINMASFGAGTISHVAGELFKMMTGVSMLHVPYRGGAPMRHRYHRRAGAGGVRRHAELAAAHPERAMRALAITGRRDPTCCPMCRRSPRPCRDTRSAAGAASGCRGHARRDHATLNREINAGLEQPAHQGAPR